MKENPDGFKDTESTADSNRRVLGPQKGRKTWFPNGTQDRAVSRHGKNGEAVTIVPDSNADEARQRVAALEGKANVGLLPQTVA